MSLPASISARIPCRGLLLASAGEVDDPADTQSGGTTGVDLHRDLIGSATDTLGLNLERGLDVVHSLLEGSESVATLGLLGNDLESGVNDALSGGLLAVKKDLVDELSHQAVVVNGVRLNLTTISCCTTRHVKSP